MGKPPLRSIHSSRWSRYWRLKRPEATTAARSGNAFIVSRAAFEVTSGDDELTTYRFNTGTAKHTFCKHCGVHPFYVPRSHPDKIDVNVRCLAGVDVAAISPLPFDGQNWEAAMAARTLEKGRG